MSDALDDAHGDVSQREAPDDLDELDHLVAAVRASARYRTVDESLARRLGARELARRRGMKEAVKATRSKLHQMAGAYLDEPRYAAWLADLRAVWAETHASGDGDETAETLRRAALRKVMARHASTRERLPILDQFYTQTLGALGPIHSLLDIACGLNPLALRWAPLAADANYYACDIYGDMTAFLGDYFTLEQADGLPGLRGVAEMRDVLAAPPTQRAEVALLLKALPCLEQIERPAGELLLRALRADHLLISFPARSLGGRSKGMPQNYEARFHDLLDATGLAARAQVTRFAFATELAFLVSR